MLADAVFLLVAIAVVALTLRRLGAGELPPTTPGSSRSSDEHSGTH
jgi:hypothetical protein